MSQGHHYQRTERVQEILDLALERPAAERDAFVSGACADDQSLRTEVLSLLSALDAVGDLLEPPAHVPAAPPAESLTGLQFGSYTVGSRIGAGGMGVVYLAQDTRLGRAVAVKALPPHLTRDARRRARFEQEARVVAAINHPNIAAIYGVQDTPRGPVMVLEYVPGPTLAERSAGRPLPLDECLAIAGRMARGLEAAHAAGIVHRDLKPANVKISPNGTVKILDFGIAKVMPAPALAGTPSELDAGRTNNTSVGVLGTAAYMSPEQARGQAVDRRSDLWAFGCVLFEMLTGSPAFDGDTTSDTIAAILRAEPDWRRLPTKTPDAVLRVLHRCLQKDPDDRQRDAGDARLELEEAAGAPEQVGAHRYRASRTWRQALLGAAVLLAVVAIGGLFWRRASAPPITDSAQTRFSIDLPPATVLVADVVGGGFAISPDGRSLVYSAGMANAAEHLFLRRLDAFEPVDLARTNHAAAPCFSPDGRWIAYCDLTGSGEIKRVAADGDGTPTTIAPSPGGGYGTCWGPDDTIVFSSMGRQGLKRVAASGGQAAEITTLVESRNECTHTQPEFLSSGGAVLFTCLRMEADQYRLSVEAVSLDTGERHLVVDDACQPRHLSSGHLLFFRAGSLMAATFDARSLALTGEPQRVLSPLAGAETIPRRRYSVSANGTLAYLPSSFTYDSTDLAWYGLDGSVATVYEGRDIIDTLRIAPDGRSVALTAGTPTYDVWVHDLARNTSTRLTSGGNHYHPVWTRDGRRVAFETTGLNKRTRFEWAPLDGSAPAETLFAFPGSATGYPSDFAPDGKLLAFTLSQPPEGRDDIYLLPMEGERTARRMLVHPGPADRYGARFSPDGSLIAYTSEETGRQEVYVQPFPSLDRKVRVSADGGIRAAWSGEGKTLFFRFGDKLYSAEVAQTPELTVSTPRVLLSSLPDSRYDASADGTRFILGRTRGGSGPQRRINIVIGWGAELNALSGQPVRNR